MKPHRAMVGTLLAFLLAATAGFAASKDEEQAIAAFKKLGRTIKRDEQKPGKPAYRLTLKGLKVKDADLAHLKALKHLRFLNLANTKITDKGLVYLKNLKELEFLTLEQTKITDAGLASLKKLTKLQLLILANTKVTDQGLAHLQGLKMLRQIDLRNTKVSGTGIGFLKRTLPDLNVRATK